MFSIGSLQATAKPDAQDTGIPGSNLATKTTNDTNNQPEDIKTDNTADGTTPAGDTTPPPPADAPKFGQAAGNFLKKHGTAIAGMGLDALGNHFSSNVENSSGVNKAFAAGDMLASGIGMINPVFGLAAKGIMTAFKGINDLGGKHARRFSVNQDTANTVGASYGGSMADIMSAAQNSGKKYGMFSSSARRKANRAMDEAERQQNIMTGIADESRDMQAMAGNQFNYTRYQYDMNGGYDMRYMRAAKQGMKITDKIEFFKQERNNIQINLDTREIEWEPIISNNTYWEPVITDYIEEFKEGGSITIEIEEWEPEIEDRIYWEPIITDAIEEFKEGGSIKEELETPEIEETNQKNLIPEGALHKNKHHMEHTEGLTQKGIPVIDNTGEQQAEIELDEIIFTLEVTKKLEELYKDGSDEAAIEAGKLLVKEILFNTDDRTGLIAKCEKGGKINESR